MSIAAPAPEGGVLLSVKAVPGASRDEVVGRLGDRLKIRISAPPEGGRANKAIRRLLAKELGVKPGDVAVTAGETSAEKTVRIAGVSVEAVESRW